MKNTGSILKAGIYAAAAVLILFCGCAGLSVYRAEAYVQNEEWIKAVMEYRRIVSQEPGNIEAKMALKKTEFAASDFFYKEGMRFREENNTIQAMAAFQQGLLAMPGDERLARALARCHAVREADRLYTHAYNLYKNGSFSDARSVLVKALEVCPGHKLSEKGFAKISKEAGLASGLVLSSDSPVTMNFKKTNLREAFDFLEKSFGVNVIFDKDVKAVPVDLFAEDITFEQALDLLLLTSSNFYKRIGPNTILVAPDIQAKRNHYEDLIIRTFQLNVSKAGETAEILKNVLNIRRITVNDRINTVTIRDTEEVLSLAEKLIAANDRKPAEILFDVEIIEINRTKADQLGLNYGVRFSAVFPSIQAENLISTPFLDILKQGTITLPSQLFNIYKQDVDAKMLANPKIRVLDGRPARIHIGDRVPLRSSTIQDATGQVRITYEYRDIGIRLQVTPKVNFDRTVFVELGLEVSTLGSNLGTQAEPAYSIGTRDATTTMLLKDGETAVLGGLIRDEERVNRLKIPGLGSIPVIGELFTTSVDASVAKTEVLLTITPRIVRGWDYIESSAGKIYSGTETRLSGKPDFLSLEKRADGQNTPVIAVNKIQGAGGADFLGGETAPLLRGSGEEPVFSFSDPQYNLTLNREGEILIKGRNLNSLDSVPLSIAFNPKFVRPAGARALSGAVENFKYDDSRADSGIVEVTFDFNRDKAAGGAENLAVLKVKGVDPGISYLVFLDTALKNEEGAAVNAKKEASRIVVK
ncbi:MAG: secretin N-terminal domain-containing protein [Candidatus Goldiibacteriota bacterium]